MEQQGYPKKKKKIKQKKIKNLGVECNSDGRVAVNWPGVSPDRGHQQGSTLVPYPGAQTALSLLHSPDWCSPGHGWSHARGFGPPWIASCSTAASVYIRTRGLAVGRESMGDASFPSFHPLPLSGISHQGMALWLRIEGKMAGGVMVGRIVYLRETDLAKAEAVVGPWPQIRDVAYDNDMMPKNRDGAYEDYGLTRTYEEGFRGA